MDHVSAISRITKEVRAENPMKMGLPLILLRKDFLSWLLHSSKT